MPNQTVRTQSMISSYDYPSTSMPTLFGELRTAPYDLRYWTILRLLEEERQAAAAVKQQQPSAPSVVSDQMAVLAEQTSAQLHDTTVADDTGTTCLLGYLDDAYLRDEANVFEDWQRSSAILKEVLGKRLSYSRTQCSPFARF